MDQDKLLSRISGGIGCDLVTGTNEFTARKGRIYAIIPNENDSKITNMTEELPLNAPSTVKTTVVVTSGTYIGVNLKENRLIIPDYPLTKFTPAAGTFWVYYNLE